ncbi:hypothetical protein ABBQ38_010231 [Trebouxia sp. C0009 RCD-2024]
MKYQTPDGRFKLTYNCSSPGPFLVAPLAHAHTKAQLANRYDAQSATVLARLGYHFAGTKNTFYALTPTPTRTWGAAPM